jgi:hypothetical protein
MRIRIDGAAVAWMTRSPAGPVGRRLARTAQRVEYRARQLAPGKGPMKRGVSARMTTYGGELAVEVVSSHPATIFVIKGTKPHWIPESGNVNAKTLKFNWGGRTVYFKRVWHPGTKANNFLKKALEDRSLF